MKGIATYLFVFSYLSVVLASQATEPSACSFGRNPLEVSFSKAYMATCLGSGATSNTENSDEGFASYTCIAGASPPHFFIKKSVGRAPLCFIPKSPFPNYKSKAIVNLTFDVVAPPPEA